MNRSLLPILTAVIAMTLCSCRTDLESNPTAARASRSFRVTHTPPQPKDIVEAAIASGWLPLSVSPTCKNVGTEPSDATIGRYLAGFLAELSPESGKNGIETSLQDATSAQGESVWVCQLTIRHVDGDDRWGWGVRFQVRKADGIVLQDSFICTGAG